MLSPEASAQQQASCTTETPQYYIEDGDVGEALRTIEPNPTRIKLARELLKRKLPVHLRAIYNCSGTQGKQPIAKELIEAVETKCFGHFPLKEGENKQLSWQTCKDAINEWCRRAN